MLRRATYEAVRAQVGEAATFLADPGGGMFYADLLRRLYHEPGDLIIVEQDVVPPPGALRGLLDCPGLWCGHRLPFEGKLNYGTLGLARFSAELKRLLPLLFDYALARPPWLRQMVCLKPGEPNAFASHDPRDWPSTVGWPWCDSLILRELETRGAHWHEHSPPVEHLHDWAGEPASAKIALG
jgi:hypothetical protein